MKLSISDCKRIINIFDGILEEDLSDEDLELCEKIRDYLKARKSFKDKDSSVIEEEDYDEEMASYFYNGYDE